MWWHDAVIYQIYPRSFQDSDGDGIGDLQGIASRLDHIRHLGADALWLSPIYPSPLADSGYDVSDFTAVDPVYGSLEDFDALVAAARARGLKVLMDLIPCHTSIEHAWFRRHPDRYVWADGDRPPNNWVATFGGPAWTRDPASGRWYLHSFYPEQPDLDWRNPEVPRAFAEVIRFWLDRGVDGFRLDALDRLVKDRDLRDDPPARAPFALPLPEEYARLEHLHSTNSPDIRHALEALREAAGDALLVGEVYLPTASVAPYLDHLDLAFIFELFHAPWDATSLGAAIQAAVELRRGEHPASAWVMANHDFPRLSTRVGSANERASAMLLLTLPGTAFVYQGDEMGLPDGPGARPPFDRAGRDAHRHPMRWDRSRLGGFTSGRPWLPPLDPVERNVHDQRGDPSSLLSLYRRLIELRPRLGEGFRMLEAAGGVLAYERGDHLVAINTTAEPQRAPASGDMVLATSDEGCSDRTLSPHAGVISRRVAAMG